MIKGGENVSVTMIRDFAHADNRSCANREKAAIGLFVTLAEPGISHDGRPMREEAAALGFLGGAI